ncbi:MAG: hypothetical protein QNJ98_05135 [Planctomycetota bacterium]|nr:hypothetical protein [Planctomycetota bacterium]
MPLTRRHPVLALLFGIAVLFPLAIPASAELNEDQHEKIVEAATRYFDLGEDAWKGRKALLASMAEVAKAKEGYDFLGDLESLRKVIYASRYFEKQMSDKKWRNEQEIKEYDNKGRLYAIKGDGLNIGFSLPKKYPNKNKKLDKQPRPGPWPLLISTVERRFMAMAKEPPPWKMMKERFPKNPWQAFLDEWIVLAPVAPGAVYVDPATGKLRREYLTWQFVQFLRHYHIDFDRIVLDGMQEALLAATSQPVTFAGFVLRGGEVDETIEKTVVNFSHVPTYVVKGQEKLAEALKKAGHENITVGDEGASLMKWLGGLKRTTPKKFSWNLKGPQHQFAHWINFEQVTLAAEECGVVVSVDDAENTINIEAKAITELSLFLNDDVVDLSRPVKVVVNGHVEREEDVARDLDMLFNRDPLKLRTSMYFGLLFPARLVRIGVRAPVKKEPEKPTTPAASPEDEAWAVKVFEGAKKLADEGKTAAAIKRLEAVLEKGNTSVYGAAKALLEKLKGG